MAYTAGFREQVVRKLLIPGGPSAAEMARETGVSAVTLSKWVQRARSLGGMTNVMKPPRDPKSWTFQEKLQVLAIAEGLAGEALGALLRREGLHESDLEEWREAVSGALSTTPEVAMTAKEKRRLEKRVKELEKELRRKEHALAETAALLVLEKKLKALGWDERDRGEDDEPEGRSDE